MSRLPPSSTAGYQQPAANDIYTVLLLLAVLALAFGTTMLILEKSFYGVTIGVGGTEAGGGTGKSTKPADTDTGEAGPSGAVSWPLPADSRVTGLCPQDGDRPGLQPVRPGVT